LTRSSRLKYWYNKKFFSNSATNVDTDRVSWFLLPYIDSTSEKFSPICKDIDIKLAFFNDNKLNRFIKVQKDTLPKFDNKTWSIRFVVNNAMHLMWDKHAGNFPAECLNIVDI